MLCLGEENMPSFIKETKWFNIFTWAETEIKDFYVSVLSKSFDLYIIEYECRCWDNYGLSQNSTIVYKGPPRSNMNSEIEGIIELVIILIIIWFQIN